MDIFSQDLLDVANKIDPRVFPFLDDGIPYDAVTRQNLTKNPQKSQSLEKIWDLFPNKNGQTIVLATEGMPFTGNSLEQEAVGGSETAVISLARELSKLGHRVIVYCVCKEEGLFTGILYQDIGHYATDIPRLPCDILIISRFFHLADRPTQAKVIIGWQHDLCVDPDSILKPLWNIDFLYCLTAYHKQTLQNILPPFCHKILKQLPNGIDQDLVQKASQGKPKKHKIMYISRPERGLLQALDSYEKLQDKTLDFLICYYPSFNTQPVIDIEHLCFKKMLELQQQGFPVRFSQFPKAQLYAEIAESKAVIYPTQFPEVFCIAALETQACGTVFIGTHDFALTETVGYAGIPGQPQTPEYHQAFMDKLRRTLEDERFRQQLERTGQKHAAQFGWDKTAQELLKDVQPFLASKAQQPTLTACIIAKDAAQEIVLCLESILTTCDEIIVGIDPATTDNTKAILAKYPNVKTLDLPQTIHKPDLWGFANARNFVLNQAKTDWVLFIDSDEQLIAQTPLRNYLRTSLFNAYNLNQVNIFLDNQNELWQPTRLFRRGYGEYVGFIHENPVLPDTIDQSIDPQYSILAGIWLLNSGTIGETLRRKKTLQRNIDLVQKDILENVIQRSRLGQKIRYISIYYVMRDLLNRHGWGLEKFSIFNTQDFLGFIYPTFMDIYNAVMKDCDDITAKAHISELYKRMQILLQQASPATRL